MKTSVLPKFWRSTHIIPTPSLLPREKGLDFAARVGERFDLVGENPMSERMVAFQVPVANRLLIRGTVVGFAWLKDEGK